MEEFVVLVSSLRLCCGFVNVGDGDFVRLGAASDVKDNFHIIAQAGDDSRGCLQPFIHPQIHHPIIPRKPKRGWRAPASLE